MVHDYIHKYRKKLENPKQHKNPNKKRVKKIIFATVSIFFLILVISIFYQIFISEKRETSINQLVQKENEIEEKRLIIEKSNNSPIEEIDFQFYSLLPNMKTELAFSETEKDQDPNVHFILQLASFYELARAERLKAQLANRYLAQIDELGQKDKKIYRVQIGSLKTFEEASKMKHALMKENIFPIIIKVSKKRE